MEGIHQFFILFTKGGIVMYPLTLCSILVIAVAIDRYYLFSKVAASKTNLLQIEQFILEKKWSDLAKLCQNSPQLVMQLIAYGLTQRTRSQQDVQVLLENRALLLVTPLKERLNYLDTIITLAPLLGLLGTVTGMIQTFSVLNLQAGQTSAITGGVGEALIATATGLCIATLALMIHSYFVHQLDRLIFSLEKSGALLLDHLSLPPGEKP